MRKFLRCALATLTLCAAGTATWAVQVDAGAPGGSGLAILSEKILTVAETGPPVVNQGVLLVKDGLIEAVGRRTELEIPEGYEVLDVGDTWLMPGLVDLHSHIAGRGWDLHDYVYLTNPGLRASAAVDVDNQSQRRAVAAGVTTILVIPGSGTNMSGQGILMKTGLVEYEDKVLRNPGSLKLAQAGNPERYAMYGSRIGRALMNWNTRGTLRRGMAYARGFAERALANEEQPTRDPQWDVFHHLLDGTAQISAHTQLYQVVLMTITMVKGELGIPVYLDHSTIGGWRAAPVAKELEVPAIVGPRSVDVPMRGMIEWAGKVDDGFIGIAAGYQAAGMTEVGFNTDAPVIPQEEFQLQAAMAARYGFRDEKMQAVAGLTIVPARAAGIADKVGSLEPGKHADILAITGHPADPRSAVLRVFIEGRDVYNAERTQARLW